MTAQPNLSAVADLAVDNAALLIAFASEDGEMVDQHFGSAQGFFLYAVTADKADLLANKAFGAEKKDGNEDKLKPRLAWLAGADVMYCASIGGSATRQLIALGINPIEIKGGPDVADLIEQLQQQLQGEPEFWLANILKRKALAGGAERFAAMDGEGWDG